MQKVPSSDPHEFLILDKSQTQHHPCAYTYTNVCMCVCVDEKHINIYIHTYI